MPGMPSTIQLPHPRRAHVLRRAVLAVGDMLSAVNATLDEARRRRDEARRRYPHLNFDE